MRAACGCATSDDGTFTRCAEHSPPAVPAFLRDFDPQAWLAEHFPKHARGNDQVFRVACQSFALAYGDASRMISRHEKVARVAEILANRIIGAVLGPQRMMTVGERFCAPFFETMPTMSFDDGTLERLWGSVPTDEELAEISGAIREHAREILDWYAARADA